MIVRTVYSVELVSVNLRIDSNLIILKITLEILFGNYKKKKKKKVALSRVSCYNKRIRKIFKIALDRSTSYIATPEFYFFLVNSTSTIALDFFIS